MNVYPDKYVLSSEKIDNEDFARRFCEVACSNSASICFVVDENLPGPSEYTYGTIYNMVCRFEQGLKALLIEPKQLIAIRMERNINVIVSILACLLHRSPFLLIEPSTPTTRLTLMLNDAQPVLLITDEPSLITGTEFFSSMVVHSYKEILNQGHNSNVRKSLEIHSCDDTMYIMYTSGSTGQPKGVVVPYRAIYNRFRWMWKAYPWVSGDVQLWKTSVVFGDCIWEMLGGVLGGVPTVVASKATVRDPCLLLQLIERKSITRITLIPTMLSSLLKLLPTMSESCLQSLRYVIVSGEALPKAVCKQFLALSTDALLLNLYGSTEIGNDATYYEVRHLNEEYDTIPIGKPITNIYYKIVHDELWVAGDGLCSGYLNDIDQITCKFTHDIDGRRYFKTGDCVHECVRTGQLLFFVRIDSTQVKIRGARVELEEVEAICMQHPLVHECGCFVHESKAQLIAILYSSSSGLSTNDIRQWLSSQLPDYEVPSVLIFVDRPLDRTASGKTDRKHLILAYEDWRRKNVIISPANISVDQDAQRIMNLWCKILEIQKEERRSSELTFTELGGHSLLAIQLQCDIQFEFHIHVPIEQFFCHTTVNDLIKFIQRSAPNMKQISSSNSSSCQTAPLTLAQKNIWIADELQNSLATPVYNVACAFEILSNDITVQQIKEVVYALLQRHENLRTIFSRNTSGEMSQTVIALNTDLTTIDGKHIFEEILIENADETDRVLTELAKQKFHLDRPQPLCRFFLCQSTKSRILAIVFHHLIIDGWSIDILTHDLEAILMGQNLPPIAMQFCQYAAIEHELSSYAYDADLLYWKKQLNNGALTATRLLHDHKLGSTDTPTIARVEIMFPLDVTHRIDNVCKEKDVTPFMILLSTFTSLLARYTQETDVIIGTPVANRMRSEIEHTIGLFMNMLVLRTDLSGNPNFDDLLSKVKKTVLEAFAHQSLPFVSLLSALEHKQRDHNQDGLFQIILAYQNC